MFPVSVVGSAVPPNGATVTRLITIVNPCAEGTNYCELGVSHWECSDLSCEALEQIRALGDDVDRTPPNITLLGGATLTVDYGMPVAVTLDGCPSKSAPEVLAGGAECWATAEDDVDGDVSAMITVRQLDIGSTNCDRHTVVRAVCTPATYVYLFSVTDTAGNAAFATVTVYLVERTAVSFDVRRASMGTSAAEAEVEAAGLRQQGGVMNSAFRDDVATQLNSAGATPRAPGLEVEAGDVTVTGVTTDAELMQTISVTVNVKSFASGGRRRILQSGGPAGADDAAIASLVTGAFGSNTSSVPITPQVRASLVEIASRVCTVGPTVLMNLVVGQRGHGAKGQDRLLEVR